MVEAGRLGRKSGHGFYDHGPAAVGPEPRVAPPGPAPARITVEGDLGVAAPLLARWRTAGIEVRERWGEGAVRIGDVRLALTDGRAATVWSELLQAPVIMFDLASDLPPAHGSRWRRRIRRARRLWRPRSA